MFVCLMFSVVIIDNMLFVCCRVVCISTTWLTRMCKHANSTPARLRTKCWTTTSLVINLAFKCWRVMDTEKNVRLLIFFCLLFMRTYEFNKQTGTFCLSTRTQYVDGHVKMHFHLVMLTRLSKLEKKVLGILLLWAEI